jgi:hypothetical protein
MGNRPQALINKQVLDKTDIIVGIFWSRFGSPTGEADSGTEEEIRRSLKTEKPVLLYFCSRDVPQKNLDGEQFAKVQAFKREMADSGLYWEYGDLSNFRMEFRRHLADTMEDLLTLNGSVLPKGSSATAKEPELEEVAIPGMGTTFSTPLAGLDIPMPKITTAITDRDRVRFIKETFSTMQAYFDQGLKKLQESNPGFESDLDQVTASQFACRIYVHGSEKAKCKIWIDDSMGSPGIHYSTNDILSTKNNSYNESLSIKDDELVLVAQLAMFTPSIINPQRMTPREGSQYLWVKFTEHLSV